MALSIIIWLIVALVFLGIELISPTLFFAFSFFIGALSASTSGWYGFGLIEQSTCFVVLSALSIGLLRPLRHYLQAPLLRTNTDALIGKSARALTDITPDRPGYVLIDGQRWYARVRHGIILAGHQVQVHKVSGAHVVVSSEKS